MQIHLNGKLGFSSSRLLGVPLVHRDKVPSLPRIFMPIVPHCTCPREKETLVLRFGYGRRDDFEG